jgi:hypothetical protein
MRAICGASTARVVSQVPRRSYLHRHLNGGHRVESRSFAGGTRAWMAFADTLFHAIKKLLARRKPGPGRSIINTDPGEGNPGSGDDVLLTSSEGFI